MIDHTQCIQGAGESRQEKPFKDWGFTAAGAWKAANICWISLQLLISKSIHQAHKVDFALSTFFFISTLVYNGILNGLCYTVGPCCLSILYTIICQVEMISTLEIRNVKNHVLSHKIWSVRAWFWPDHWIFVLCLSAHGEVERIECWSKNNHLVISLCI